MDRNETEGVKEEFWYDPVSDAFKMRLLCERHLKRIKGHMARIFTDSYQRNEKILDMGLDFSTLSGNLKRLEEISGPSVALSNMQNELRDLRQSLSEFLKR